MRVETINQLLSYYCLAKINDIDVKKIGLILPLQLVIVEYDLSNWDWKPFYECLKNALRIKLMRQELWRVSEYEAI